MSQPEQLKIGALAARTGTTSPTVRYYESIGLLPAADRGGGTQRRYDDADVRRLTFIRRCREFGFPVEQVRALVGLIDDPTSNCTEARDIAREHLDSVRAKLAELRALETMIAEFADRCDTLCAGGTGPNCVPLAELSRASADSRGSASRGRREPPQRTGAMRSTPRASKRPSIKSAR